MKKFFLSIVGIFLIFACDEPELKQMNEFGLDQDHIISLLNPKFHNLDFNNLRFISEINGISEYRIPSKDRVLLNKVDGGIPSFEIILVRKDTKYDVFSVHKLNKLIDLNNGTIEVVSKNDDYIINFNFDNGKLKNYVESNARSWFTCTAECYKSAVDACDADSGCKLIKDLTGGLGTASIAAACGGWCADDPDNQLP